MVRLVDKQIEPFVSWKVVSLRGKNMGYARRLHHIINEEKLSSYIVGCHTTFIDYEIDSEYVICTVNDKIVENAFVVSPYTIIIKYGLDEIKHIKSRVQRILFYGLLHGMAPLLKYANIDKVQILNNYLYSMNFFSARWETLDIDKLTQKAIVKYPTHALMLGSVNDYVNPKLYDNLNQNGWLRIARRKVFILHSKDNWHTKRDVKKDFKLLDSTRFCYVKIDYHDMDALTKAQELYSVLFLEKHSDLNIEYTASYLQQLVKKELLEVYMLWDNSDAKYVGVIGLTHEDDLVTIPIVGYDMNYAKKDALYRRLMIFALAYTKEHDALLNMGAGAENFKETRGANPVLDYMFVKVDHLPYIYRFIWTLIAKISYHLYEPFLKK